MAWSPSSKRGIGLPARRPGSRRPSDRHVTSAALTAGLLLTSLLGAVTPIGHAASAVRPAQGLALIANPTRGFAPLLVDFQLSLPNGSFPQLSWSFGDGAYLNGSTPADLAPAHEYAGPGTFNATVTASYPGGPLVAALPIDVLGSNLTANATAAPLGGTAPLNVTLIGTPYGGSGTFVVETWDLGDGDHGNGTRLLYTYVHAGVYVATFTVADSAGHWANASVSVNVSATPPPPARNTTSNVSPSDGPSLTTPITLGLLAVAGAVIAAVGLWVRASRREFSPPETLVGPTELADPAPVPPTGAEPAEEPLPAPVAPLPRGSPAGPATIALRLVRHLADLPREGPMDLPSPGRTQAGIAEALGVGQSGVSKILRRLEAAGTVSGASGSVVGSPRRVRIYRLTGRGERLGRALQEGPLEPRPREPSKE
jgi:hypothetical protein